MSKQPPTDKASSSGENGFIALVNAISSLPAMLKYGCIIVLAIVLVVLRGVSIPDSILWLLGIVTIASLITFTTIDTIKFIVRERTKSLVDAVIHIRVYKEGDKTSGVSGAEVRVSLPEPLTATTQENGSVAFTSIPARYIGKSFLVNASKENYKSRKPVDLTIKDKAYIEVGLEESSNEIIKTTEKPKDYNETSDTLFDFKNIVLGTNDRYWLEVEKPTRNWFPYDKVCAQYFQVAEAVEWADPSFDITVMNMSREPVLLTAVGIETSSVTWIPYALHRAGDIPTAEKVAMGEAYRIQMPLKWPEGDDFDPDEDTWIDLNTLTTIQLPDPIYMQSKAPFRYTLTLCNVGEGNHFILRLWARTSAGEARSHQISVAYDLD